MISKRFIEETINKVVEPMFTEEALKGMAFSPESLGYRKESWYSYDTFYNEKVDIKITHEKTDNVYRVYIHEGCWKLRYAGTIPNMDFGIKILDNIK